MTLRGYLTMMILATLTAGVCFGLVIGLVDPYTTNSLGYFMFYGSLFATVMGFASIIGFIMRFVILRKELATRAVIISFRQAFLMAFLVLTLFFLLAKGFFSWLNLLALIVGIAALEFFLISLTTVKSQDK